MVKNPSKIKNAAKRAQVYEKFKQQKKILKKKMRAEKVKAVLELGEEVPKAIPKTQENTRVADETMVDKEDPEVIGDEKDDEFSCYHNGEKKPKIMITTRPQCSRKLFAFIGDLMQLIPNAFFYPRGEKLVTDMAAAASSKDFTHLIVLSEKNKVCNGMLITHLPYGPTAFYKVSNFQPGSSLKGHGRPTSHTPELIMNNFGTRLGRRTGRFLGSIFPKEPELEGRQVVTFHNQRDFIFVRHHRYIYKQENEKMRARLQELGPRFTMKMKWLQEGTFNTQFGEYEWYYQRAHMDKTRRKFHL